MRAQDLVSEIDSRRSHETVVRDLAFRSRILPSTCTSGASQRYARRVQELP